MVPDSCQMRTRLVPDWYHIRTRLVPDSYQLLLLILLLLPFHSKPNSNPQVRTGGPLQIHVSAQAVPYKSTGPHRRSLTVSKHKLLQRSCGCRRPVSKQCFDVSFIANAIDAVGRGRGRGRRRRRLRLRHRRRREHALFCSRLTSVECTNY